MTHPLLNPRIFILLLIATLLMSCGSKLEINVSPTGDDSASGSRAHPFKTLARAQLEVQKRALDLQEGTLQVILHDGVYPIDQPLLFSGLQDGGSDIKVEWKAAPGERPIISGARQLKGKLQPDGTVIASYNRTDDLMDLYVNGQRAQRARTPNKGFFRFEEVNEEVLVRGEGRAPEEAIQTLILSEEANQQLKNLSDSTLDKTRFHAFFKWDNTIRYLSGRGTSPRGYLTRGAGMKPWNKLGKDTRFFLENYPQALDSPGEWLGRDETIKYIPRPEEGQTNPGIFVPVAEKWLIIEGRPGHKVRNLSFEGISFQYSNYVLPAQGFEPSQAASTIDAAIMIDYAENIEFRNCEMAHTGQHGIWFRKGVSDCVMDKCHLFDLGAGGIRIGDKVVPTDSLDNTGNIRVNNCIVQSGGYNFPSAVGVWIGQSGNNQITHNDIADFRYTGVSVGWIWGYAPSPARNNKITYNHIHHIGWALLSDMAGVYTLGISEGTEVSHNLVHDIHAFSYGGWGLYTDEGSSYIRMENNLVFNTKTGGFHQHYGRENTIRNNIFAYADLYQIQATRVEDHLSFSFENNIVVGNEGVLLAGAWKNIRVNMNHNCYWFKDGKPFDFVGLDFESWKKQTGHDQQSIIADPGSIDSQQGTFQMESGIARQINFSPFDPSEAGVYGDEDWKQQAQPDASMIREFQEAVKENRKEK